MAPIAPALVIPERPLERFAELYSALMADRPWWRTASTVVAWKATKCEDAGMYGDVARPDFGQWARCLAV